VLIRFEASNYRSVAEPVELSMVAVDRDRAEAREQPMVGASLVPVAAVYGPNASGKSNIVASLAWIREAVQVSLRAWDDEIPVEPFAFGDRSSKASEFVVECTVDGVRFEYLLEVDRTRVLYEALFHYPEKKRRRVFEREGDSIRFQRGLHGTAGTRELLTPRVLVLSIARRFDEPLINRFAGQLLDIEISGFDARRFGFIDLVNTRTGSAGMRRAIRWFEGGDQPSLFDEEEASGVGGSDHRQALALLRLADLGIDDVLVERAASGAGERGLPRVRLLHRTPDGAAPLDFVAESEGTRTWFGLIGPVLTALRRGSLLLFDELDASLHPTLSAQLIRLFHDPATNPLGAQLVFTTHDTSLLNHLNRDEVWLTEKRADGSTRLGALAEFAGERVRKSSNLESAYLHGRFGALPKIDHSELLRALGLIG
jgi:hypothetical protein